MNNRHTSDYDKVGEIISWIIAFISMFAFFPIGLILLRKQSAKNQATSERSEAPISPGAPGSDPKKTGSPFDKKSGKLVSTVLLIISIALFVIGLNSIVAALRNLVQHGLYRWPDLALGVFFIIGGFVSFFSRNIEVKRISRYKKYYTLADGHGSVPVRDLARVTGLSDRAVKRDLQAMIDAGYFGRHAYIDNARGNLILSAVAAARQSAGPDAESQSEERPANEYMSLLGELRTQSRAVADIAITGKIERIEALVAKIFRHVEEHPHKQPQIRRLVNYYLPTTLKMIRSYATLEKQGIKGENIMAAKENIGRTLDTLARGFERQLDQLFKSDAIEISADLDVIENMLQQDGLTASGGLGVFLKKDP